MGVGGRLNNIAHLVKAKEQSALVLEDLVRTFTGKQVKTEYETLRGKPEMDMSCQRLRLVLQSRQEWRGLLSLIAKDYKMDKPLIFISHSSKDKHYALILEDYIGSAFEDVETFVSSNPNSIPSGEDWVQKVLSQLDRSELLIIVLSNNALESNWVFFELGYTWKNLGDERIHYLLYPGVDPPSPLSQNQGKLMTEVRQLRSFFQAVANDLGREYQPDIYELRNLTDAAFQDIPRVVQNREFDAWKYHLRNSNWAEEELTSLDETKTVSTCESDMNFQIVRYVESYDSATFGPWSKGFPDPASDECLVDLNVSGATVKRLRFAQLDGDKYLVPVPEIAVLPSEGESSASLEYYYDRNSIEFLVGKIIGYFDHGINLEEFARRQQIKIVGTCN